MRGQHCKEIWKKHLFLLAKLRYLMNRNRFTGLFESDAFLTENT